MLDMYTHCCILIPRYNLNRVGELKDARNPYINCLQFSGSPVIERSRIDRIYDLVEGSDGYEAI